MLFKNVTTIYTWRLYTDEDIGVFVLIIHNWTTIEFENHIISQSFI